MNLREWTKENWYTAGGLVSKSFAARYLEVCHTRINQLIKEGKIREFRFNDTDKFVSLNDIDKEVKDRKPEFKRPKGSKVASPSDV